MMGGPTKPLHCHPAQAWALMKLGTSVKEIARRSRDNPKILDRAIWAWRAEQTRSRACDQDLAA